MADNILLITGGSGHVGFRVLVEALKAGYPVRATVRSQAKADTILAAPSIKVLAPGAKLTFIVVPDILAPGAFDDAVEGVQNIIHCASPLTHNISADRFEDELIAPAVNGTTGILESAHKMTGIQRIVITSSIVAVIPIEEFLTAGSGKTFDASVTNPYPKGPFGSEFEAYAASKTRALIATEEFVARKKPSFEVSNIMPGFVIGKDELVTDVRDFKRGTNIVAFGPVLGAKSGPTAGNSAHVDDVALMHVLSLDPSIAPGQNFAASAEGLEGTKWETTTEIVARHFPDAVAKGVLPNNGTNSTKPLRFDAREAESILGFRFKSFEEQVISITQHYLELLGAA
ncbi:MAG: hypothetical protein M1825_003780 [Sarcosagium campestre]|nr:MAG: hypothetical protein M1825_003780 [Sarcosagium campestre]